MVGFRGHVQGAARLSTKIRNRLQNPAISYLAKELYLICIFHNPTEHNLALTSNKPGRISPKANIRRNGCNMNVNGLGGGSK